MAMKAMSYFDASALTDFDVRRRFHLAALIDCPLRAFEEPAHGAPRRIGLPGSDRIEDSSMQG
jgi:hypothetical protein